MALFTGLSAVATQRLAETDSEELRTLVAGRVHMARFVLDLLNGDGLTSAQEMESRLAGRLIQRLNVSGRHWRPLSGLVP
ncbi:hypothetical protein QF031_002293 [Pseudarthrobacter defluvii]|uniref:hypothetical protein n=1 Tax=Pseudarthrobacter defluvii TaxID=410837 RepID=UPI00277EA8DA|nr:hypothetical protein [Pseudarthrobacter defluvii]MDQ0769544.1 hypothetical protein [Pseudarthrobacter defluvii]